MHDNAQLIERFYTAFTKKDSAAMNDCYHQEIVFQDPAFGVLRGQEVHKMWEMLISKGKDALEISYSDITATEAVGSAKWTAVYQYGKHRRLVTNNVTAVFTFKDGKILSHHDNFNMRKWAKQALGNTGTLLGGTAFLNKKIKKQARKSLEYYIKKTSA